MSIQYSKYVWADPRVRGSARLMALALADCANDEGTCWPSVSRLASMAGVSTRQAQRLISDLEELGVVQVQRGSGRGCPSVYVLLYGMKTVTPDAETVTRSAETVSYVTPKEPTERVTRSTEKVTRSAAKGDTQRGKGDTFPHAYGDPSPDPSKQHPSMEPSSSAHAAPAAFTQAVHVEDEDEDGGGEYDPVLVAHWENFQAITNRPGSDPEWHALQSAFYSVGNAGVERILVSLRNVWSKIRNPDNLANWLVSATDKVKMGRGPITHHKPLHNSAAARAKAYLPQHWVG